MEIAIVVLGFVSLALGVLVLMCREENAELLRELDALKIKLATIRRLAMDEDEESP